MAWWDDVLRNIFGGAQQEQRPTRSSTSSSRGRQGGGNFQPAREPRQQTSFFGTPISAPTAMGSSAPARETEGPERRQLSGGPDRSAPVKTSIWPIEISRESVNTFLNGPEEDRPELKRDITPLDALLATTKDPYESNIGAPDLLSTITKTPRDKYSESFRTGQARVSGTDELTDQQWNALSPETQRGVLAQQMIYAAAMEDRKARQRLSDMDEAEVASYLDAVEQIFGAGGGSETYAPNTIRVLQELGYQGNREKSDLDLFLNGQAYANTGAVLSGNLAGPQADLFAQLADAPAFENPELTAALDRGAALIQAVAQSGTFSNEVADVTGIQTAAQKLPQDRLEGLDNILVGMADPGVWNTINSDAQANAEFQQILAGATEGLDPILVADYFKERYPALGGNKMPFDQFQQYWIKKG